MPTISYLGKHVKIGNSIDDFVTVPFFLRASRTSVSSASEGGTYDTSIFTHPDNPWTVTDSCTWISINSSTGSGDGTFSIVVNERATGETATLSGRVTINSRAIDISINVTQSPISDFIDLVSPSYEFIASGGTGVTVSQVNSMIAGEAADWTAAVITGGSWLSVYATSGQSGTSLQLTASNNTGNTDPRNGTVDVSCGTATETMYICQDGNMILCTD